MKVGVISDTHNRVDLTRLVVEELEREGIHSLIHAGDIGPEVASYLASLPMESVAVYGNSDRGLEAPGGSLILGHQPLYFEMGGRRVKLMHQPYFLTPDSEIIIYGHLHRFQCERGRALYLNPGEVCGRERPRAEGALLDLDELSVHHLWYDLERGEWGREEVCP
ncbi:MAG: metallophosphoesterase family protein [Epsilonproteobacteria bacterium]|nr:metallophosphoesterase family protein [Campylobacterota bacterium]